MRLHTLIAVLLLVYGFFQPGNSLNERIQLWTAGPMHEKEVIGKTGQKWFALYSIENGFELRSTIVTVLDSPTVDGLFARFVKVDQPFEALFLVRGITGLREGPVKTVFSGHQFLKPFQSMLLQLSGDARSSYQLYAGGTEGSEVISDYTISLYSDARRQTILDRTRIDSDTSPTLRWAGDLDRDGKLDLLMDLTDHYNARVLTLFLSSRAAPDEMVRKVASFRRTGC